MLKIPKGLKKKKKDKKHKHKEEDELFNKDELESYRKEQQATSKSNDQAKSTDHGEPSNAEDNDEWKKFNALTAGIDNILQKTQQDLDRIKSTSFFQRKAQHPPLPKTVLQCETGNNVKKKEGVIADKDKAGEQLESEEKDTQLDTNETQEIEYNIEEELIDDSIFETSYVDAIAKGELKLTYIPDSPTKEDDSDPFDTSIADKFIESNPRKRYLNLGCAVQVLSGKGTIAPAPSTSKQHINKRRVKPNDLLLNSFDDDTEQASVPKPLGIEKYLTSPTQATLLDNNPISDSYDMILPAAPAVTPIVAPFPAVSQPESPKTQQLDLSEFVCEISATSNLNIQESIESIDNEFEKLATESLAKKEETAKPISIDLVYQTEMALPNIDFPSPISPVTLEHFEIDPFDTSVAEKHLLPGKREIALIEQELLSAQTQIQLTELEDADFDPRAEDPTPLPVIQTDLLTQKPEDDTSIKLLTPQAISPEFESELEDFDPFDTSHISGAPGQSELKIIERELQATKNVNHHQNQVTDTILMKYNITEKSLEPKCADILTGAKDECDHSVPLVQPQVINLEEIEESFVDPFDTSIADNIVPGKTELKILENELINCDDHE